MKIVAIDLGTHTGIADNFTGSPGEVHARTINLANDKEVTAWGKQRLTRRDDPRIGRFAKELDLYRDADVAVFEDVPFMSYTKQTQLWASLRAVVWLTLGGFGSARIMECVPVTSLKVFATGAGNATKGMMKKSLELRFPHYWKVCYDDNAIDAMWLLIWAETTLSRVAK